MDKLIYTSDAEREKAKLILYSLYVDAKCARGNSPTSNHWQSIITADNKEALYTTCGNFTAIVKSVGKHISRQSKLLFSLNNSEMMTYLDCRKYIDTH